jgi:hypothetical protein
MEASDMLDLIHFYFEVEHSYYSEEHMKSSSKIKEALYEDMYGKTYKYKHVDKSKRSSNPTNEYGSASDDMYMEHDEQDDEEVVQPFNPAKVQLPPIQPETKINESAANPYEGLLDAPLG